MSSPENYSFATVWITKRPAVDLARIYKTICFTQIASTTSDYYDQIVSVSFVYFIWLSIMVACNPTLNCQQPSDHDD